jgi:ribosomal protein S27E
MNHVNAPLSTREQQDLYQRGYLICRANGQKACEDFARVNGIVAIKHCAACESEEPVFYGTDQVLSCFVCGSIIETKTK